MPSNESKDIFLITYSHQQESSIPSTVWPVHVPLQTKPLQPWQTLCDCCCSSSRSREADVAMKFPASDWQQPTGISVLLCLSHGVKGSSCCHWGRSTSLLASSSPAVLLLQHTGASSQLKGNGAGSSPRLYMKEETAGEEKAGDASSLVYNAPWESRCKAKTETPAIPLGAQHALGDISPWRLDLPSQYFEKYMYSSALLVLQHFTTMGKVSWLFYDPFPSRLPKCTHTKIQSKETYGDLRKIRLFHDRPSSTLKKRVMR